MSFLKETATALTLAAGIFTGAANGGALSGADETGFVPVGNRQGECGARYSGAVKQLAPAIINTPVRAWKAKHLDASIAALSPEEQCSLKKDVERMLDSEATFALRALDKAVGLAQGNEQIRSHIKRDVEEDPDYLNVIYDYTRKLSAIRAQMGVDKLRPENYLAERRVAEDAIRAVAVQKKGAVLNALDNIPGNAPAPKPVPTGREYNT